MDRSLQNRLGRPRGGKGLISMFLLVTCPGLLAGQEWQGSNAVSELAPTNIPSVNMEQAQAISPSDELRDVLRTLADGMPSVPNGWSNTPTTLPPVQDPPKQIESVQTPHFVSTNSPLDVDPDNKSSRRKEVEMADYTSQEEYDAATTDAVARKQEYGEQRTDTTRAFLRTVTPLLRTGQAQWDLGVLYSTNELTLPVLLPGPVANNQLYQIRTLDSILGFRYGVTDRLQWNGSTQVGWQNTQVTDGLTLTRDNAGGIGDLKTGFNYLLYRETECRPAVIASFDLTAPTGNGRNPIAPGNAGMGLGVWTFASDILMVKAYDPLVLFWGAGYRHYAEGRFGANYIKPGDSFQYNFGTGFGVNERVTLSAALLGSYALETQLNSQSLAGTNADIISLRLAATMIKRCNIVEPFVNFGITDRAPDATLGVVWTW